MSPGKQFIVRKLPTLFVTPTVVGFGLWIPVHFGLVSFSTTKIVLLSLSTVPLSIVLKSIWTTIAQVREARILGAIPIPQVSGKWLGNLDVLLGQLDHWKNGYPGDGLRERLEELGQTINMKVLWEDHVVTTDPDHIKEILATNFTNYVKGPNFIRAGESVLGSGVFNSDGDMWKFHRSMSRPFFTRERLGDLDTFTRHADVAISKIKERLNEGVIAVDCQDVMSRFTLDAATDFLFGSCVDSLSASLLYPWSPHGSAKSNQTTVHPSDAFGRAFADAQAAVIRRIRVGEFWPLWEMKGDATAEQMKVLKAYIDPILREALRKKESGEMKLRVQDGDEGTLLDHLVQVTDDISVIQDELLNIMIAGRDTTSSTLTFATYFLAMHPDVLKRVRAEVIDLLGTNRQPSLDDLRQLKYLRAVINETLRLMPPVPFNVRTAVSSTTLKGPNGKRFYIPAGMEVAYSVLFMHRRKDLWGPDADIFDPDRFLDERLNKYLTPNPFIFLPFNAGPRICLGQQFAYNETSLFLVRLLQSFDTITLVPEAHAPGTLPPSSWSSAEGRKAIERFKPKVHLTMFAEGGIWMKFAMNSNQ